MRSSILCAAIFAVSCSSSPTSPTPVAPDPPRLSNLRWDVSAPGCPTQSPPSPLPNAAEAVLEPGPHGTLVAHWPYRLDTGRRVTLHASLIERGTELLVCEWDVADL
jgi:hypothetical protein